MRKLALVCLFATNGAVAKPYVESPTARAMRDELARSMDKLAIAGFGKPYFVAYSVYDGMRTYVSASFGALVQSQVYPQRALDIDLRVGDYGFDNSNVEGDPKRSVTLAAEDDYDLVRRELWLATDRQYKRAVETLERKRAVAKNETKNPDDIGSFSKEPPSKIGDERTLKTGEQTRLEALAKKLSGVFRQNPDVYDNTVIVSGLAGKHYFVSSEGSNSIETGSYARIDIEASTQADDGMPLHATQSFWAASFDQLPVEAELLAAADKLSKDLSAARKAPIVDDYGGPVLFTGVAAAQAIRSLLADELGGTPAPKSDRPGGHGSQSALVGKVGQRILPAGVTVVDDPTIDRIGKQFLVGGGKMDEEGVPAQKVSLVENGMFRRFLMSRAPRKGFEHSNGHGSSSAYSAVRAAPANVLVSAAGGLGDAEMRRRAAAAAKEQGLAYYLVVDRLESRRYRSDGPPNPGDDAALPRPATLRRVYLDGREELVRGGTFAAVSLRSLKDLVAVGANPSVYSYVESGLVSIAAPALLFRDIDIKKPTGSQRQAPIAPRPKL